LAFCADGAECVQEEKSRGILPDASWEYYRGCAGGSGHFRGRGALDGGSLRIKSVKQPVCRMGASRKGALYDLCGEDCIPGIGPGSIVSCI